MSLDPILIWCQNLNGVSQSVSHIEGEPGKHVSLSCCFHVTADCLTH
jgi:hypothetical protein